ncbi:hypothetical protein FGO68_gene5555 [Halteria grandinella]|uniref:Uncharacterized protein n=1 Tax=Halteria grandinella TaxID=5974 RepID=A0A8J8SWR6_HALGN|nr:hypothetical protein FGO68_gene5555 [Halteria grandinella]
MALRSRGAARSMPTFLSSQSMLTPWAAAVRGPKKKKGPSKSEAPDSSDIVNIFKDRPDPEIHATDRYPPFLMGLIEESYTPDDVMMQMYRGERIPTGPEQWTLVSSFRRTYLNDQNRYMKDDWVYESDDDIGEDTGAIDEEDMQQAAAGGAAGEGAPAGEAKKEGGEEKKEGAAGGDKK